MKKIMVCCGSSMITSTMAINKLKQAMQDAGIDAKFIQCKFAEVQGKVKEERPDVIVPTGVLKDRCSSCCRDMFCYRGWRKGYNR